MQRVKYLDSLLVGPFMGGNDLPLKDDAQPMHVGLHSDDVEGTMARNAVPILAVSHALVLVDAAFF